VEPWELVARERVRDTLAAYNWAGDAGRLEELAAAFCPDGVLHLRDGEPVRGREAIAAFLQGVTSVPPPGVKRIVRHNVTNTRFVELTAEQARVESYFTVVTELGLDHYGRYRDVLVPVGDRWLLQQRFVSTDWRAPTSTMAPPPT
jgi:uncharacterized protein (TIGR02246 family)